MQINPINVNANRTCFGIKLSKSAKDELHKLAPNPKYREGGYTSYTQVCKEFEEKLAEAEPKEGVIDIISSQTSVEIAPQTLREQDGTKAIRTNNTTGQIIRTLRDENLIPILVRVFREYGVITMTKEQADEYWNS